MTHNDHYDAGFWAYDAWPSGEPYKWEPAARGGHPDDATDFHVDLGCGKLKKARIGIDRYPAEGVNVVMDLDALEVHGLPHHNQDGPAVGPYWTGSAEPREGIVSHGQAHMRPKVIGYGLPFPDSCIESIVSHHAMEHLGMGFIGLMDECYRVLKPGGLLRIIVPLFPSTTAVEDPDHRRYFMPDSFASFCGTPGDGPNQCWLGSFSVPYTKARFQLTNRDMSAPTDPSLAWTDLDRREMRVSLRSSK